jgi:AraC-like DNA-binding protein
MASADLVFLHGQSVPECDHDIDKHFVGYYTLQFMSAGQVELAVDMRRYALAGRWFWSAYPGPRISFHSAGSSHTWQHRYVAFRGQRVQRWIDAGLFPVWPQQPLGVPEPGRRFDSILNLFSGSDHRLAAVRATHTLEGLLLDLAEARSHANARPDWLDAAISRLDDSITSGAPDYGRLCQDLGLSESTLRRQFRQAMGLSPHEYLIQTRIARAKELLAASGLPLKAIARRVGYSDVYYFSRQVRQLTGLPPAGDRRSIQS